MKKIIIMLIVFVAMTSCKQKETPVETTKSIQEDALDVKPTLGKNCYTFEGNGSKIDLKITDTSNGISGTLDY